MIHAGIRRRRSMPSSSPCSGVCRMRGAPAAGLEFSAMADVPFCLVVGQDKRFLPLFWGFCPICLIFRVLYHPFYCLPFLFFSYFFKISSPLPIPILLTLISRFAFLCLHLRL